MEQLVRPGQESDCCTGVASPISESSHPTPGRAGQEFNVIEGTTSIGKPCEIFSPYILVLVAVAELDVRMGQKAWRESISSCMCLLKTTSHCLLTFAVGKLLQPCNDMVFRGIDP